MVSITETVATTVVMAEKKKKWRYRYDRYIVVTKIEATSETYYGTCLNVCINVFVLSNNLYNTVEKYSFLEEKRHLLLIFMKLMRQILKKQLKNNVFPSLQLIFKKTYGNVTNKGLVTQQDGQKFFEATLFDTDLLTQKK